MANEVPSRAPVIGPFFGEGGDGSFSGEGMVFTGTSLHFSTPDDGLFEIPIYKREDTWNGLQTLDDYLFPEPLNPFRFTYVPRVHSHETAKANFLSMARLLGVLFRNFEPGFPVTEILQQFVDRFPIVPLSTRDKPDRAALVPSLSAKGFALDHTFSYGDILVVYFCWLPSPLNGIAGRPPSIGAGVVDFKPRHDGTLGKGGWAGAQDDSIYSILCDSLRPGIDSPIDCFSPAGIERCLKEFEWQPKHLLTKAELHMKRFEAVKENPLMWDDPRALARLLRESGLYSEKTGLSQVQRQIEKSIGLLRGAAPDVQE